MKNNLLVTAIMLCSLTTCGQGGISVFYGKIIDAVTQKPIPAAYITIPSVGYGTAANEDGNFRFSYPRIMADSQMVVSVMGYKNFYSTASGLSNAKENIIRLTPVVGSLNALGISDARALVKAAIDSLKTNCAAEAIFQNGFYCETVVFEQPGLVKVSEGLVRVERFPQAKNPNDKIKYLRGRKLEWRQQTDKMDGFGFENGAAIVTRSLETSLPSYLTEKEMRNYEFMMDSVLTSFDDVPVYSVSFEPNSRRVTAARSGKIYIEPTSKAIVRIEYQMTPEAAREAMNMGISKINLKGKSVESYMQYRKFGDKWMLQDSGINFGFAFNDKSAERSAPVNAHLSLRFIANISQPLLRSSIADDRQLTNTENFPRVWMYTDDFWEGQNFLLPTNEMRKITDWTN